MQRSVAPEGASTFSRRDVLRGLPSNPAKPVDVLPAAGGEAGEDAVAVIGAGCLSIRGVACRVCADFCEPSAIKFKPALGGRAEVTITDSCTACRACVPACPVGVISLMPRNKEEANTCA